MKKLVLFIFFLFICTKSFGANVLFISPNNGPFSVFANQMLNGLNLSLIDGVNVVKMDMGKSFSEVDKLKPEVIVGPFLSENVKRLLNYVCNRNVYVILPFSKDTDNCSNAFFFGYDPLQATRELSRIVCDSPLKRIGVFYSFSKLNTAEKDEFLKDIAFCGKLTKDVYGIPSFFNVMDQFVRDVFGVRKLKKFSGLTKGDVFKYSLHLDALVVFAPSDMLTHLLDLIDYYDIDPGVVYTQDNMPDENILSLRFRMLKRIRMVVPYYMCDRSKQNVEFVRTYRSYYYDDPTQFSALGYDIGMLINWILTHGSIEGFADKALLEGNFLFFDDKNDAAEEYKTIGYKELLRCKRQMLSK